MKRPPRDPQESILSPFLIWRMGFVALILVAGTFSLFVLERVHEDSVATLWDSGYHSGILGPCRHDLSFSIFLG
jgi:hypothetical protein